MKLCQNIVTLRPNAGHYCDVRDIISAHFCHCVQKTARTTERRKKIRVRSLVILLLISF